MICFYDYHVQYPQKPTVWVSLFRVIIYVHVLYKNPLFSNLGITIIQSVIIYDSNNMYLMLQCRSVL